MSDKLQRGETVSCLFVDSGRSELSFCNFIYLHEKLEEVQVSYILAGGSSSEMYGTVVCFCFKRH